MTSVVYVKVMGDWAYVGLSDGTVWQTRAITRSETSGAVTYEEAIKTEMTHPRTSKE